MNLSEDKQLSPTGAEVDPKAPFAGLSPEELMGKGVKRTLPTQLLIFAIVLGVSGVSLWWMRREGTKAGVVFDTLKIDYQEPDEARARTYARIIADLTRIQTPLDVALGEFGKSPFMLSTAAPAVVAETSAFTGPTAEELAAKEARERAEARHQQLMTELGAMRLHSVMEGRVPLARIDELTVRVGDTIRELFTVVSIEGRAVSLEADGQRFTLSMEESKPDSPKRAPVKLGAPTKRGGK